MKLDVTERKPLLVAKGTFGAMGGAERDLIRVIPDLNRFFDVTVATIQPSNELEEVCSDEGILLIHPENSWEVPKDPLSIILDSGRETASKSWSTCEGLVGSLFSSSALHLVSGDGSLPLLDHVPVDLRIHLHLLEPHRGLYEEILHKRVDGSPKRNLKFTKAMLSRARKRDQELMASLTSRQGSIVSGNSLFSSLRAKEVYGIEAGVLWPCVDTREFPKDPSGDPANPFPMDGDYVVSIGRASFAKGTYETISMLRGTELSLAHVGGGDETSLNLLSNHADSCDVNLWISPRISSPQLVSLMRNARAIVSMAHGESFGLSPIEAFSVGTPAVFVDEGGFRDTIIDNENGRLIERNNIDSWHSALEQAAEPKIREKWSKNGRIRISELDLTPKAHARRIWKLLNTN